MHTYVKKIKQTCSHWHLKITRDEHNNSRTTNSCYFNCEESRHAQLLMLYSQAVLSSNKELPTHYMLWMLAIPYLSRVLDRRHGVSNLDFTPYFCLPARLTGNYCQQTSACVTNLLHDSQNYHLFMCTSIRTCSTPLIICENIYGRNKTEFFIGYMKINDYYVGLKFENNFIQQARCY